MARPRRNEVEAGNSQPPSIPDHELLRPIGGGSYGEVWLARTALGAYRAVKIVHRHKFGHDRPFEREFGGIQKFEPISRSHEGLVDLLQVGRNDAAGYFYYVMELADAADVPSAMCHVSGELGAGSPAPNHGPDTAHLNPGTYVPRTLRSLLRPDPQRSTPNPQPSTNRLPLGECIRLGLSLTNALAHLHGQGLVHRDIKPSNIIFVDGVPKLADVGLVAGADESRSYVGTEGFIPPEGPGTPQADLYSLGIVLYEMSTGKSHQDFPEPLADLAAQPDHARRLEFNAVIHKACVADPRARYQSAEEMLAELELLQRGQSVKRRRALVSRLALAKKLSLTAAALALLVGGGWLLSNQFDVSARQRTGAPAKVTSIAVVPFVNEDRRVRSGYLSLSLAEGVCTALTNVASLRVARMADVLAFRRKTNDAPDIGRQLGAQWVLQAVFRNDLATRSNQMIVVTKLTHLPDGVRFWSADYDRTLDDLVAIQRDVLTNVARVLGATIPATAIERMETNLLCRLEAWKLVVQGGHQLHLGTREGFDEGVKSLHKALELDPTHTKARFMMAWGYTTASEWHLPPHQAMLGARSWALRALEVDPTAAFAHCILGDVKLLYDWDWKGAEEAYRLALELEPESPANHAHNAVLLLQLGRFVEARAELELAIRLDPSDLSYVVGLAGQAMAEKKYDEALDLARGLVDKHPDYYLGHYMHGRAFEKLGRYDEALAEYHWVKTAENGPDVIALIAHLHAVRGERTEALGLLAKLEDQANVGYVAPIFPARIYLRLGDRLKALALLEQARDERCGSLTTLKFDDDWDSLRDEPRFQTLLKQVGFEK